MRVFALELDNDLKGIEQRDACIEGLIRQLPRPELVVLPELSRCSYMASQAMWKYADDCGRETADWAVRTAKTCGTYIGVGYLDRENGDYYNRYLIAGPEGVCGSVTKSEGESAVFRQSGHPLSRSGHPAGQLAVQASDPEAGHQGGDPVL